MIVFEIGHNHNGNIKLAKLMIDEVKKCGGSIAKFQLYDVDEIKKPWQSRYFELMAAQLDYFQVKELKEYCDEINIEFMASAFDTKRLWWLEELGVKRHKLASRSINDTKLIEAMEETGKPIIVSLGAWDKEELPEIKNAQFLYCVSEYPAYIKELPSFEKYDGFSDHTIGTYWTREAIKRGAKIIEKHFTLSRELPGFNQKNSATPTDMKDLMTFVKQHERGISY